MKSVLVVVVFVFILFPLLSQSQELNDRIVQFSGVILADDNNQGVLGAHVYVPKAGRGTTTNIYGYFSMPVLKGDSVVVSAVGYRKQYVLIPHDISEKLTLIIELTSDTTFLKEVEILPFPTEEMFKQAVLTLQLPNQENIDRANENFSPATLALMAKSMSADGYSNYRYYNDLYLYTAQTRFQPRYNPFLNPFAWAQFIQSLKKKK